jgi:hypothetical protein
MSKMKDVSIDVENALSLAEDCRKLEPKYFQERAIISLADEVIRLREEKNSVEPNWNWFCLLLAVCIILVVVL